MQICIRKSDGRIVGSQSKGSTAVLLQNSVNCGELAGNLQVEIVSDIEFKKRMAIQNANDMSYVEKRINAYPPIGEQLDDLFKKGAFSVEMTAKLKAVKDKFPK